MFPPSNIVFCTTLGWLIHVIPTIIANNTTYFPKSSSFERNAAKLLYSIQHLELVWEETTEIVVRCTTFAPVSREKAD
ncbi:hypothetical protein ASD40_04635 [Paenibacillus sp. Root444D2]|nr:hypothetical protein ASD40_04635 [Paenibacillus sp. Root444D2]KRE50221.1 hypothetical protein ASG85_22540 [Paenibacillus sp. Soil724D2]